MMAVADGAKGVELVRSVTSIRVRAMEGDSKTGWVDRLAAVTGWPRARRKLQRAAPTWPVPPMTRIGGSWLGSSCEFGEAFGPLIDADVSNRLSAVRLYESASPA